MLPVVAYNNMEGSANFTNFGNLFDENVILNCVRTRKKVTELPNCPICSCTIRQGELDSHLALEVEKLHKLSGGSKRKLSSSSQNLALPGPSNDPETEEDNIDVKGCTGSDVYQRVHGNRLRRLRVHRRSTPPPQQGECPICNATYPTSRLQRHALRCLKRTGAQLDEDVPDTSSEEGSIDVENDEPAGGSFGAEYQWCGEWRVRTTALQDPEARPGVCVRRASNDQALVVDGDEDTELYGPAQYSPSRIETNETPAADEQLENGVTDEKIESPQKCTKPNGLVEASAETRFQALKARIRELESKQNSTEMKCLICLGSYVSPAVSIQCWHVHCEECWLQSLKAKKICPQCNAITTMAHLRRIYM